MALGTNSASNRNEYQRYFLGVKAAAVGHSRPVTGLLYLLPDMVDRF